MYIQQESRLGVERDEVSFPAGDILSWMDDSQHTDRWREIARTQTVQPATHCARSTLSRTVGAKTAAQVACFANVPHTVERIEQCVDVRHLLPHIWIPKTRRNYHCDLVLIASMRSRNGGSLSIIRVSVRVGMPRSAAARSNARVSL